MAYYRKDKEDIIMILFIILTLMIALLTLFTIAVIGATGAVGIVLFGDVIVCVLILVWFVKRLIRRKKK